MFRRFRKPRREIRLYGRGNATLLSRGFAADLEHAYSPNNRDLAHIDGSVFPPC